MKKMIISAALACVALAGCVKNEVTPDVKEGENVISFQTATGKPQSRSVAFETTKTFAVWAFLEKTKTAYINNDEIKFHSESQDPYAENTWHATDIYLWPKTDKLTFYAYTPTSIDAKCTFEHGISVENYNVDTNKDIDFMVADKKEHLQNNTTNESNNAPKNGVPTVFRHKLTKVGFRAKLPAGATYGQGAHPTTGTKKGESTIYINSIEINQVKSVGDYSQSSTASTQNAWTNQKTPTDHIIYTGLDDGKKITTTETTNITNSDAQTIYLPQTLDDEAVVVIKYTIYTWNGHAWVAEEVTATQKLKDLSAKWEMNKNITYVITIDLGTNYIYWDPIVEDWEPENSSIEI